MNGFTANYRDYADLAKAQVEGADYRVYVRTKSDSLVAVVAPHGGYIEQYTYYIARGIAGEDFNFYLFEGIRHSENYAALHLTGHPFDEPRSLELLSNCDHILAIHVCGGEAQQALIGGLDEELKAVVAQSMAALGVETLLVDHPFPATDPRIFVIAVDGEPVCRWR